MIDLTKYYKIAEEINGKVADFLLGKFGSVKEIRHKTESHWGIAEDLESNKMYEDFLRLKTPEVSLYTEEGERDLANDLVWVIDPIEGTSNYRAGNPFWATQIALLYKGEPVLGIVNAPVLKQKFTALKGGGSFLNAKKIQVSPLTEISRALVDFGRGTKDVDKGWLIEMQSKLLYKIRTNRSLGATGVCISYCATGIVDAYLSSGCQIYDLAPGALIVREAGGKALNFNSKDWSVNDKTFLVSNEILAKEILKIIV